MDIQNKADRIHMCVTQAMEFVEGAQDGSRIAINDLIEARTVSIDYDLMELIKLSARLGDVMTLLASIKIDLESHTWGEA